MLTATKNIAKKIVMFFAMTLFILPNILEAQKVRNCSTMNLLNDMLDKDPGLRSRMELIESQIQKQIHIKEKQVQSNDVRTIRVVVHVVYNTNVQNISDDQIHSQIRTLNQDFRKMANTPGDNDHPVGADTKIEFKLASTDPNGNPTNGITRTLTSKTGFYDDDAVMNSSRGGVNPWPANKYMNIWVCSLEDDILGYATFPGSPSNTDGVVINYLSFGSTGTAEAPFDMGRSATHEVGHYLNLYHIWGDGGCGIDDEISDTPPSDDANYGCPSGHESCGSLDMVENYMDYTDDVCMNIFTKGQSARMNSVLDVARPGIIESSAPDNSLIANANGPYSGLVDETIQFSSSGSQNPEGTIAAYYWNFGDGGNSNMPNPTYIYSTEGVYNISLTVTGNGNAEAKDYTTVTITTDVILPITPPIIPPVGGNLILSENFDSQSFPPAGWSRESRNDEYSWEKGNFPGDEFNRYDSGNKYSAVCDWDYYSQDEWLISPEFDLTSVNATLEFYTGYSTDWLSGATIKLYISSDGLNNWQKIWEAQNDGKDWEWRKQVIDLSNYTNKLNVRLAWQYIGKEGDSVGIDGVKIQAEGNTIMVIETPQNLAASIIENSGIHLEWEDNIANEDGYKIEKSVGSPDSFEVIASVSRNTTDYVDFNVSDGNDYYYRVKAFNSSTESNFSNVVNVIYILTDINEAGILPVNYEISQNYPNPFNPSTTINYAIPDLGKQNTVSVKLVVYNLLGQEVAVLVNKNQSAGYHQVIFDASSLPAGRQGLNSGIYIYQIRAGNFVDSKKLMLLK